MTNKNSSEWRVSSNPIAGRTFYGVYRVRDINDIDHSGNREIYGNYHEDRETAEVMANMLNLEAVE